MIRVLIGGALSLVGGIGVVVLLTYGGAVFPHIVGPSLALSAGVLLLARNQCRRTP